MVETDWRKILSTSHEDLNHVDKEQLCESLAWMDADDIEINFGDLKTLFRLSQDILKIKSEQVNNLRGEIEILKTKNKKRKTNISNEDSPAKSTERTFEANTPEEEIIKSNKEILGQLHADIAKLEAKKMKLEEKNNEKDSDSSRDPLSEIDAVAHLEKELTMKNKHIRKLIVDLKMNEEENCQLKDKIIVLKDKLKEATQIIERFTEELCSCNTNMNQIKETLVTTEEEKSRLGAEIEYLKLQLQKETENDGQYEFLRTKIQHWKNVARSLKAKNEKLLNENSTLRQQMDQEKEVVPSADVVEMSNIQINDLKDKLFEASNKIFQSARIIGFLKTENQQLKSTLEEAPDSFTDYKNESDEGKEQALIKRLKRKVHSLTYTLKNAEELLVAREKEIIEITSRLHLLENGEEGLDALLAEVKSKKRQIKLKDEAIKSFVKEVNTLNGIIDELQLENTSMREKLNIPLIEKVPIRGVLKKFQELETNANSLSKKVFELENEVTNLHLVNRSNNETINKLKNTLKRYDVKEITPEENVDDSYVVETMPEDGGDLANISASMAVQFPSLEAVLTSMEARHAAGWFAPHMAAVLELRSTIGGRDALLNALHDARKETLDIMKQLTVESQKCINLEEKLTELQRNNKTAKEESNNTTTNNINENEYPSDDKVFGNWILDKDITKIDLTDKVKVEKIIVSGDTTYQTQLKTALMYFNKQFNVLCNKMTEIAVQTADEQNRWNIQEEKYKAEIENLKIRLSSQNEDSQNSAGLIDITNVNVLERKCAYLEESYRYVRTLTENLKNENLELKRNAMIMVSEYENRIQHYILNIITLTDKLRNSVPLQLFIKQNEEYNTTNIKYRRLLDDNLKGNYDILDPLKEIENNRSSITEKVMLELKKNEFLVNRNENNILFAAERSIALKQLEVVCETINEYKNKLSELEKLNIDLQMSLNKMIDFNVGHFTKEEYQLLKEQLENSVIENKTLKDRCLHVENQLDIALLQLQDHQQRQVGSDMEINMLRHQILDLQSTSDNKAIIARLSGEILITHLHASDTRKEIERLSLSLHKEKQRRTEIEEMLKAREKVFNVYAEALHIRELDHFKRKIRLLNEYRDEIVKRCTTLETTLVYVNQAFDKPLFQDNDIQDKTKVLDLELEEINSDEENMSRRSQTVTLQKPNILKNPMHTTERTQYENVPVVTDQSILTDSKLKSQIEELKYDNDIKSKEIAEALLLANKRTEEIMELNSNKSDLEVSINKLKDSIDFKDETIAKLNMSVNRLTTELETVKSKQNYNETPIEETKSFLSVIKNFEKDKDSIVNEYNEILQKERHEFRKNINELQDKISDLQSQLNNGLEESFDKERASGTHDEKFALRIVELEDQCFKLKSESDNYKSTMATCQKELERWKSLAAERLSKMEHLNNQLEDRHCHEVDSYKAESQHWLSQLSASEREQTELRARLGEQRTAHARQMADKDALIDQLRQTVHNLKGQIVSMQTLITVNDPSFDLSAIVEVEEPSEAASQPDQLELKFDSSFDEFQGDLDSRLQASSTSIWQETIVERLRREKQVAGKQNAILRRQIKALAGRERRTRLEAQNLKNQIYRLSTSGTKTVTAETAALHNKIASLQAQLLSARRDNQSSVALWDKWKRSQQSAERWQARYEEKSQELKKYEVSLNQAKSAITRLEREKRILLSKLAELKNERELSLVKTGENTKLTPEPPELLESSSCVPSHLSTQSLLDRIEAQQRRIAALELAEKGNEPLVSEYERALAEITALRGQVLKLESALLEAQIRSPMKTSPDPQPELDYWKSYCEMLKEENLQLSMRLSATEATPSGGQQRVNDLEKTVLTLRGLVSKLQAEQKSSNKRGDSRPSSGRSIVDKGRSQLESYRTEIANLKRTITDKDALLEKSKDMLKMAAEREEHLLQEV
ncbi:Centrosomal protein of 290 kDa [Eumeta japonica]|uniref:Centrosomal protein of 290 kDa n=1 Tax=Eumeta variegata TaxID=151549 RepID=A0A4C1XUB5_EUMVA|nr:Centrosomal protein of 290 kDa [Eumeta japonica]